MDEYRKISRILQLIARLRSPIGATKDDLAETFEVTLRTIERHIELLKDLGFNIQKRENRFYITDMNKNTFRQEDLIVFNLEEAALIRDMVLSNKNRSALHENLLNKLYALTDLDSLADTIGKSRQSFIIGTLRQGIKLKQQIIIKDYKSQNSDKTGNRLIEPIRFHNYFIYFTAFEVETGMEKIYKTERIGEAILTNTLWKYESDHNRIGIDVFGMAGDQPIDIKLKLSLRAQNLLVEEFTDAARYIHIRKDGVFLETEVYKLEGVGRYIMGLIDEIEIISPPELREYVEQKIKYFNKRQ